MPPETLIAGVDEAGRGPLAGPVIAAAVILKQPLPGVDDSKKLTALQRQKLFAKIQAEALCFAFGRAEVAEIENLNIHHATLLAMKRAIEGLSILPEEILVDGLFVPGVAVACKAVVGGDSLVPAISAASILAKVARDEEMIAMETVYPGYGFAKHKGYGTAEHQAALRTLGPCPLHRRNFAPVLQALNSKEEALS